MRLPGEVAPGLSGSAVHGTPGPLELRLNPQVRHVEIPTNLDCLALLGSGAVTTSGDARRAQRTDEQ